MIVEIITNNIFMSGMAAFAVLSIFIQWIVMLSLKGYVKASANMKTTRKKVMLNLKNQYEAMYQMNVKVKNMDAYVDKYMYKLRFAGITYSGWEKLPYISAGIVLLAAAAGVRYGYTINAKNTYYADIIAAGGIILACLYIFFHIFGIKTRKQQIHVQLVDYLENYLANRLSRTVDNTEESDGIESDTALEYDMDSKIDKSDAEGAEHDNGNHMEEDMEMLKRLIKEMDTKKEMQNASEEVAVSDEKQSDIDLLEEFVQSFLS